MSIDLSQWPDEVSNLAEAIEAKVRQTEFMVDDGVLDWTDEDEALLTAWRKAFGSTGEWEWWGRELMDSEFIFFGDTREQIIAQARRELGPDESFVIVEACHWQDDIRAEDARFAATRNKEIIAPGSGA